MKKYGKSLALLLSVILCLSACGGSSSSGTPAASTPAGSAPAADNSGRALNLSILAALTTLNPLNSNNLQDTMFFQQMNSGLFHVNEITKEVEPRVAEFWTISEDGKTYTFKIRSNAKFHNGDPVKASDCVWSFNYAMGNPRINTYYTSVESVEAADDSTFIMHLKQPNGAIFATLSNYNYILSEREATEQGEYVSAINCLKEIALQQMILTKRQYGKENGYIAWHGYQSFKPGEVTPEQAHEIGLQLAKEMWGDRFQIIVTTHLDKDHLHNHFCFNSVSFLDGKKYNYSKSEQRKLREVSDRICREHGLSVIEKPHKAPSRQVWLDEKSGRPTRYNVYREDVKEAINFSRRPYYMEEYLRRKGYITDFTGKHWKIRLPQYEHFTRLDTLDERWTPEHIQRTMGAYASFGNRRATITYPSQMPQSLRDWFKPFQKTSHIYRLYLHYCYLLGVLPKKTTYRPTSPYLKEDLKKLDELSEQVRYMSKYGIETFDDLYADRDRLQGEMDKLIAYRTKLQNKIRRASPAEKEMLREEKSKVTEQITTLRKQLKLNKGIEERSIKIQEKTDLLYANEYRAKEAEQNRKSQRKERDAR